VVSALFLCSLAKKLLLLKINLAALKDLMKITQSAHESDVWCKKLNTQAKVDVKKQIRLAVYHNRSHSLPIQLFHSPPGQIVSQARIFISQKKRPEQASHM
jgi:hypothetical protein